MKGIGWMAKRRGPTLHIGSGGMCLGWTSPMAWRRIVGFGWRDISTKEHLDDGTIRATWPLYKVKRIDWQDKGDTV